MSTSLSHMPSEHWEFDVNVTDCFEDMLMRSIPEYHVMRRLVFDLGCLFVHPGQTILDLGCSRGDALEPFIRKYGAFCEYHGVEISPPMLAACHERFQSYTVSDAYGISQAPHIRIEGLDLRTHYPDIRTHLTLSILTLMFLPMERRLDVMHQVYEHLEPGGVLILVEKILGATATLNGAMVDLYHGMKRQHGYTQEAVERKRMALEGVLVPLSAAWNEDMLRLSGFVHIDCFWRWMNFAGWIAIKA